MRDFSAIRERYLRDAMPIRLGGIATNLARITSFSRHDANREVVERMIDESKWFIEWTAPETDIDTASILVELQLQLAQWQAHWIHIWEEMEQRQAVMEQSGAWSQRILEMSGLLQEDISHNTVA
jgi:hypothetical protein